MTRLARLAAATLCLALAAPESSATWSVCAVDVRTGEIGIAQATCIVGPDLQARLAVVLPGIGGGCVQQWWDNNAIKRTAIHAGLLAGTSPQEIIDSIKSKQYQFGIVDALGRSASFTGNAGGAWAGGVAGRAGDIAYAVQGNVLAGQAVVDAAVQALLAAPGPMPERLMAAMHAAAAAGGDGRCSCSQTAPASCGAPPPGFDLTTQKSAHTGFALVARRGESKGVCNAADGCANGDYFMTFNAAPGQNGPPDPIIEMEAEFAVWKAALAGRPDHLESVVSVSPPTVPGNGTDRATLTIQLVDYHGTPLTTGGHPVRVRHAGSSAGLSRIGPVLDHGDGSYTIQLFAGTGQGTDQFDVTIGTGPGAVLLSPPPALEHTKTLSAGATHLEASTGGAIVFSLSGPVHSQPRTYLLLGSLSGTDPGLPIGHTLLPLNPDWFLALSFEQRNTQAFIQTLAPLSATGTAQAAFQAPAGALAPIVGQTVSFAYLTFSPVDFASNPVAVDVIP